MIGSSQTFLARNPALRRSASLAAAVCAGLSLSAVAGRAAHPPKGAIILFSGEPHQLMDNWVMEGSDKPPTWEVKDGSMHTRDGSIVTKQQFSDFVLHVEFKVPYM